MSYTEIRHREGMPYGGMPYDVILEKLEETDQELVEQVRGYDSIRNFEDNYGDYVRSEIIDWSQDAPFLESDHTRRDPGLSRSILNLHYNGTRGSRPELPRHPEMFYGFTGNDPRGTSNNPRFDELRGHITARAANMAVRMGDNDDNHIAERPWTAQGISYGMKEAQRRTKNNLRVFSVQKEGRPWGRNTAMNDFSMGYIRDVQLNDGHESFVNTSITAIDQEFNGQYGGLFPLINTPWRHITGDTDLAVQNYGHVRGVRGEVANKSRVHGKTDQDFNKSMQSRGTNQKTLGASMALAIKYQNAMKSAAHDQDPGASYEMTTVPMGALKPAEDIASLFYKQLGDQSRTESAEMIVQNGGLLPSSNPERAMRNTIAQADAKLANAEVIVRGVKENTASSKRRIANHISGTEKIINPNFSGENNTQRGYIPSEDSTKIIRMSENALHKAGASDLMVHNYSSAPVPSQTTNWGQHGGNKWRDQDNSQFRSVKGPEWRSGTQAQHQTQQDFGFDSETFSSATLNAPKEIRSDHLSAQFAPRDMEEISGQLNDI